MPYISFWFHSPHTHPMQGWCTTQESLTYYRYEKRSVPRIAKVHYLCGTCMLFPHAWHSWRLLAYTEGVICPFCNSSMCKPIRLMVPHCLRIIIVPNVALQGYRSYTQSLHKYIHKHKLTNSNRLQSIPS